MSNIAKHSHTHTHTHTQREREREREREASVTSTSRILQSNTEMLVTLTNDEERVSVGERGGRGREGGGGSIHLVAPK